VLTPAQHQSKLKSVSSVARKVLEAADAKVVKLDQLTELLDSLRQ